MAAVPADETQPAAKPVPSVHDAAKPVPADRYESFVRLLTKHEPVLRAYVKAGLPPQGDVDEVLQEVGIVAWRKFADLDDPAQFPRWACMIARFEVLKHRRKKARDRLVPDDELVRLILDEGLAELDLQQQRQAALGRCLDKLPAPRRKLLLQAHAPGRPVKELAERTGRTPGALSQMLCRLRRELLGCIERTIAAEGGGA